MFESILYRNIPGPRPLIDVGALAEGLLFYGRVAVVGNTATLKDLLRQIPPFVLLSLLRSGRLEIYYLSDQTGVSTTQMSDGTSAHSLLRFSSPDHTIEKTAPQVFKEAAGSSSQASFAARQFARTLRPLDHSGFDQHSVLNALTDVTSTEASVNAMLGVVAPGYMPDLPLRFRIEQQRQGTFHVDTNIDFTEVNSHYHRFVPPEHSSITQAYVIALIQEAYESTYFAAALNTEVAVSPIERAVQAEAVKAVVRRRSHNEAQIDRFVDLTLTNANAIREAVNSGAVSFSEVLRLLDKADKFRSWLHRQPADSELVRTYYKEVVSETWVERLPGKTVRWGLFTGLGVAADALAAAGGLGTLAGIAVAAVDTFIADKLLKGWKPHQFVEHDLKPLIEVRSSAKAEKEV
jgi:hypothetical protein